MKKKYYNKSMYSNCQGATVDKCIKDDSEVPNTFLSFS